jgi:CelD/BcsL family acetyltransferase involved in cellulose biosynthesis
MLRPSTSRGGRSRYDSRRLARARAAAAASFASTPDRSPGVPGPPELQLMTQDTLDESIATLGLDDPSWTGFVASRPEATPYHHPAWASLIADCYRFRGFVAALRDDDGEIVAGIPFVDVGNGRRWISLAFTDYCGPLGDAAACDRLLAVLETRRREEQVRSIEIRSAVRGLTETTAVGFRHHLALDPDPEKVLGLVNRMHVRCIRKAEREGVDVRMGSERDDLEIFYRLHLATRRRQGVPIQPRHFFDGLWERVISSGLGTIFVAEVDGAPAAAAIFIGWQSMLVYKFGASDHAAWPHRPNHALFWSAISWACQSGYSVLDFGRTDLDNAGLRAFKANWGAAELELVYSTLGEPRGARGAGVASRALRTMIRHSPEIVCRQLGERFYRRAA